jgi:NAD-dependent deacetylase
MEKKKIVVLTGAGISAESGLKTFRDGDGLWEEYRVADVATPEAFRRDPGLVLHFYNMRRAASLAAQPNAAHQGLVRLEEQYDVRIITQNIDDLHERAGSAHVLHLHGVLTKVRSTSNEEQLYPYDKPLSLGDKAPDGGQLRPHVVWFGESVPNIEPAFELVNNWADIIVLIGSSLLVYPAAGLLKYAPPHIAKYVIDKQIPDVADLQNLVKIEMPATLGVQHLLDILLH